MSRPQIIRGNFIESATICYKEGRFPTAWYASIRVRKGEYLDYDGISEPTEISSSTRSHEVNLKGPGRIQAEKRVKAYLLTNGLPRLREPIQPYSE